MLANDTWLPCVRMHITATRVCHMLFLGGGVGEHEESDQRPVNEQRAAEEAAAQSRKNRDDARYIRNKRELMELRKLYLDEEQGDGPEAVSRVA